MQNVLLKLARGHIAFELGLQRDDDPFCVSLSPIELFSNDERKRFERPDANVVRALWPEIGSRAFIRACAVGGPPVEDWITVQSDRYRYLVSQNAGDYVQIVLSEYLACRIGWT